LIAPFDESEATTAQREWSDRLKTPVELTNTIGMRLRLVPPGRFLMGSNDGPETSGPQHNVQISHPVYFGAYEVTKGEFAKFVAATRFKTDAERNKGGFRIVNTPGRGRAGTGIWDSLHSFTWRRPGFPQQDNHPVVDVSWNDAREFCSWLSQKEGIIYRLPTEAEWEYACRAGTTGLTYIGDDREGLTKIGNVADATASKRFPAWAAVKSSDGWLYTSPVGVFRPNNFGLYDTLGNVCEWCSDWYANDYYKNSPENDPPGPPTGNNRVARGGCFEMAAGLLEFRGLDEPGARHPDWGFRIVREIPPIPSTQDVSAASVPSDPAGSSAKNDTRRLWKGDYSSFRNTGDKKWHKTYFKPERGNDFYEAARTSEFVEIVNSARRIHIRLANDRAEFLYEDRKMNWALLQSGGWQRQILPAGGGL
jgi:sulfatase modifying factor 1